MTYNDNHFCLKTYLKQKNQYFLNMFFVLWNNIATEPIAVQYNVYINVSLANFFFLFSFLKIGKYFFFLWWFATFHTNCITFPFLLFFCLIKKVPGKKKHKKRRNSCSGTNSSKLYKDAILFLRYIHFKRPGSFLKIILQCNKQNKMIFSHFVLQFLFFSFTLNMKTAFLKTLSFHLRQGNRSAQTINVLFLCSRILLNPSFFSCPSQKMIHKHWIT